MVVFLVKMGACEGLNRMQIRYDIRGFFYPSPFWYKYIVYIFFYFLIIYFHIYYLRNTINRQKRRSNLHFCLKKSSYFFSSCVIYVLSFQTSICLTIVCVSIAKLLWNYWLWYKFYSEFLCFFFVINDFNFEIYSFVRWNSGWVWRMFIN